MHWVIQENIGKEAAYASLLDNLNKFNQYYTIVKVVPFVGEIIPDVDISGDVICFGAYSMRKLAIMKGWNPGVYDIEWFPYNKLIDVFGDKVLNHDATISKFGELNPTQDEFFIRPTHDGKEFAGQLMSKGQLQEWQHRIVELDLRYNGDSLSYETEVMCSSIKKIQNEHRYFVVGGKVVTGSQYKLGKRVVYGLTDHNIHVAQSFVDVLNAYITHPYVIDIAQTDEGYKIIELNTLNCAGFYACDIQKLVCALIDYNS